jgi:hypothetical protein
MPITPDDEKFLNDFLKKSGGSFDEGGKYVPAKSGEKAAAEQVPTLRSAFDPRPVFKGAAAELAHLGRLLPDPASYFSSETAKAAKKKGEAELEEWTRPAPDERFGPIKRAIGSALPFAALPLGGPTRLAQLAMSPSTFAEVGGAATPAARIITQATLGAAGGAAESPEDRLGGAMSGAAGGALFPSALGAVARSPAAVSAIVTGTLHHMFPRWAFRHMGPNLGYSVTNAAGQAVGFLPERAAHAIAGAAGAQIGGGGGQEPPVGP